jgi:uncharacterized membrane protein YqhA
VVRLLAGTRYIVVIAVLGLSLAAMMLLVYAALAVAETVWDTVTRGDLSPSVAKGLTVTFVELTDAFLLGAVLLIVALGLYELFVEPELPVPAWLRVTDLDQLKEKLIGVIVVLLGVSFLGYVVNWNGDADILALGAAVAAVVAALALQGFVSRRGGGKNGDAPDAG